MKDGAQPAAPRATTEAAPHGLTLFDHARISAEIAEGAPPFAEVLRRNDVSEAAWNESTIYWMKRLGDDVLANGQHARLPELYSSAFGQAQDGMKPVPAMTPVEYAELVAQILVAGGPAEPLAARNLSQADYLRASRRFARQFAAQPADAQAFADRFAALTAAAEGDRTST